MNEVSKGIRIINYVIDMVIILVIYAIIGVVINHYVVYFAVFLVYYFTCEFYKGQTIGKMITKTMVIDFNNEKPKFLRVLFRTTLRLIPFDVVSYLFGQEQGIHDFLSKTKLVMKANKTI